MCRRQRFSNIAYNASLKSDQKFRHGAVITKNSKIICVGHNQGSRTKCLNNIRSCVHAEMYAANKLVKMLKKKHGAKFKQYTSKYTMWVVRIPTKTGNTFDFVDSKPCFYCVKDMIYLGFNKVGYSDSKGDIIIDTLTNISEQPMHKSNIQIRFENYFR